MSSRDQILAALRSHQTPFRDVPPPPESYLPVTKAPSADPVSLVERFTAELEALTGIVYNAPDGESAIEYVLNVIGADKSVLAWDDLPLPGLSEALKVRNIAQVGVHVRGENRAEALATLEPIRVGITGADAGLASTGTLVLRTNAVQSRLASLLPPVHIAILRRERLFPTLESWLVAEGKTSLSDSRSVALVSGPSRTSDIEQQSVVGVHGPGKVHVVVI